MLINALRFFLPTVIEPKNRHIMKTTGYTYSMDNCKFSRRIAKGLVGVIVVSAICAFVLIGYDLERPGQLIVGSIFGLIVLMQLHALLRSGIYFLTKIEFKEDKVYLYVDRFDKEYKKYEFDINSTRIQIFELFFPFTRYGRNYKLLFNVRDAKLKKYITIYAQHEIGGWNIDKFKEVYSMYGKMKGVATSTVSFNKYGLLE